MKRRHGSLILIAALIVIPAALADEVYMHVYGSGDLNLYDTATGVETTIGNTGIGGFFAMAVAPAAVPQAGGGTWPTGTIFGLERDTSALYVVDTSDASLTYIGGDVPSAQGLAFGLDGTLYAVAGIGDGEFYEVSTETGLGTYLGSGQLDDPDGLTVFPFDTTIEGFGTASAGDFLVCDGFALSHVDPDTLISTYIGDAPAHQTLDFGPDGTLYGQNWGGELYSITLDPLASAFVGAVAGNVDGMVVIPEPGTLSGLVLTGLALLRRR